MNQARAGIGYNACSYMRIRPLKSPTTMALASLFACATVCGQEGFGRDYGRSMVISQGGIAATSQILASQTAAGILGRGGSAVDAAIAANAVLGVVEPMMNGPGGDLFVLYWDARSRHYVGLNASGAAPGGLTPAFLGSEASQKCRTGRYTA